MDTGETPPQDAGPGRERGTLRLAMLGAAVLVGLPLAGLGVARWLDTPSPNTAPAAEGVFDKKPPPGSPLPSGLPPLPPRQAAPSAGPQTSASHIAVLPPQPALAAPASPQAQPAPPTPPAVAPPAGETDAQLGQFLKTVQVRFAPPAGPTTPATPPAETGPKLRPVRGWSATNVRSMQDPGVSQTTAEQAAPAAGPAAAKPPAEAPAVGPPPAAPPAPQAEAAKPKRKMKPASGNYHMEPPGKYEPPPPVFTTKVSPGGPTGTMDHLPLIETPPGFSAPGGPTGFPGPPDNQRGSGPESPRNGLCDAGWWKNAKTNLCYRTIEACRKADEKAACTRR